MDQIWRRYLENQAFVGMHAAIGVLAILVIILWVRRILNTETGGPPNLTSDALVDRLLSPLESFTVYFDFCSSAFIFVGLLGTIVGFADAIPTFVADATGANPTKFDFEPIARALSTSGMGIIWAVLFNLITLILDFFIYRPLSLRLRQSIAGDAREISIVEHLRRIDGSLLLTLGQFQSSTRDVVDSVSGWRQDIDAVAVEYRTIAEGIGTTQRQFEDTYRALVALPEHVRKELANVIQSSNDSLGAVIDRIRRSIEAFEKVPAKIEKGIDDSFFDRKKVLDQALSLYRDELQQQRTGLEDLLTKTVAIPLRVSQSIEESSTRTNQLLEGGYQEFLQKLRAAVQTAVQDQVVVLAEASGRLQVDAEKVQQHWADILAREQVALRDAILKALQESIKIVDHQRQQLLRLESTLPEGLALTFKELIEGTSKSTRALQAATEAQRASTERIEGVVNRFTTEVSRLAMATSRISPSAPEAPRPPASVIPDIPDEPSVILAEPTVVINRDGFAGAAYGNGSATMQPIAPNWDGKDRSWLDKIRHWLSR